MISKAYIVAIVGGGYMRPLSETIYKTYSGANKKLDSIKADGDNSSNYVILVADNWHIKD